MKRPVNHSIFRRWQLWSTSETIDGKSKKTFLAGIENNKIFTPKFLLLLLVKSCNGDKCIIVMIYTGISWIHYEFGPVIIFDNGNLSRTQALNWLYIFFIILLPLDNLGWIAAKNSHAVNGGAWNKRERLTFLLRPNNCAALKEKMIRQDRFCT